MLLMRSQSGWQENILAPEIIAILSEVILWRLCLPGRAPVFRLMRPIRL